MGFVIRKWFGVEADLSPNGMGLKWVEYGSSESKTKRQLQLHILAAMDGHHLKKENAYAMGIYGLYLPYIRPM